MAILEKIRVKLGVFVSVVIALALLSFLIDPQSLQNVLSSMSSKYDVGEINGKSVSYSDFGAKVEEFTTINQMLTGTSSQSEQQQENIRNAAWQSMLDQYLFLKSAKAAGLNVGPAELLDLTSGDMLSPIIYQNPAFLDEDGNFSQENLVNFVKQADYDQSGNIKLYWNYIQNMVYTQQYYSKYGSLFTQSSYINPLMLTKSIEENNNTTDVEFVMVPLGYGRDSTVTVTDKEIKQYYKEHKHLYKQTASRDIEYVVFEVVPSADDIQKATIDADALHDEFIETDNVKSFLLKNSDRQYTDYYYKAGELNTVSSDINNYVFNEKNPTVSPLYRKDYTFYAAKVMDTKMVPDSVYVRHILLQGEDEALADSLLTVLKKKGSNFSVLAAQYSADQNTRVAERGDIGWMTQTYMIPGMESVLTAKVGQPYILETQYGKHIVEVTKRTEPILKKQVAIFERAILPSKATYNEFYSKANALAVAADGKWESYKAAVAEQGLYSHPVNNMQESSSRLGSIDGTKEVTRWVFDAKKGKASSIITVNNNYFFVVGLKEIHKAGYATVQETASSIQTVLYTQKAGAKKADEISEKIAGLGSMQAIAEALNATVSTSENVTFASLTTQGLDPKFIGALSVSEPGVISKPLNGTLGVYVYRVTSHDTGAFFTEDDAKSNEAKKSQYNSQILMNVMADDAGVIDNRAHFY